MDVAKRNDISPTRTKMKTIFRKLNFFLGVSLLAATACVEPSEKIAAAQSEKIEPYMRVLRTDDGKIELQIAVRKFVSTRGKGPAIWLAATSHLGETNYYAALQKHLDAQSLVLFEGVRERHGPKEKQNGVPKKNSAPAKKTSGRNDPMFDKKTAAELSPLQSNMAKSLGLVFQLEAIDYDRQHFRNSDLSISQLMKLMDGTPVKPGEKTSEAGKDFENLVEAMNGDSILATVMNFVFKIIGSDPKFQAMAKLMLIETFDQIKGDLSQLQGLPGGMQELLRIIIQERNKQVMLDLKKAVKEVSPSESISIFYGSGHMDDLEKRIKLELGYRPDKQIWLSAFSINTRQTGLSAGEVEMVRSMIKWQAGLMRR